MKDENTFATKDFFISVVCKASKQLRLLRLDKGKNKFFTFIFDNPNNIAQEIIKKHWDGTLLVTSKNIIDAINELKTRLQSGI
jgi:hypothetical protein